MTWEAILALLTVVATILTVGLPALQKLSSIDRHVAKLDQWVADIDARERECRKENRDDHDQFRQTMTDHEQRLAEQPPPGPRLWNPIP
jgi:hypothetical protein